MIDYIINFLEDVYDFINPNYEIEQRNKRVAKFEELRTSGKLEKMTTSEIHQSLGITRESRDF